MSRHQRLRKVRSNQRLRVSELGRFRSVPVPALVRILGIRLQSTQVHADRGQSFISESANMRNAIDEFEHLL